MTTTALLDTKGLSIVSLHPEVAAFLTTKVSPLIVEAQPEPKAEKRMGYLS